MPEQSVQSQTSNRFDVTVGPQLRRRPPRQIIYGEPGVGKTTYGCSAPSPVLIPCEDGSQGVNVARLPVDGKCETWQDVLDAIQALIDNDHPYKTVIVDTLNGAERLSAQHVCNRDFGGLWQPMRGREGYTSWAKGAKANAQELTRMLDLLDRVRSRRNMECILLAHAGLHKSGNALGEDFQKFAPDIDKYAWASIHGWSDMIGHAAREVRVTKDGGGRFKARAVGQERYIYWEGGPGRDAKSRAGYEMPSQTLLSYEDVANALRTDRRVELIQQILELFPQMPADIQGKLGQWLGGDVNETSLQTLDKIKLETLVNRMLANLPENEQEDL